MRAMISTLVLLVSFNTFAGGSVGTMGIALNEKCPNVLAGGATSYVAFADANSDRVRFWMKAHASANPRLVVAPVASLDAKSAAALEQSAISKSWEVLK